ncbi:hypothetical protein P20480_0029 [Pseudoalteromonas sp. BSi20480]|nr:hypothetical protein P20480_0029 [Pseudoalteromonas sp. BSi20480]
MPLTFTHVGNKELTHLGRTFGQRVFGIHIALSPIYRE